MTVGNKKVLVDIGWPGERQMNLCSEIKLPQLISESEIPMLILSGATVYNYTEKLGLNHD